MSDDACPPQRMMSGANGQGEAYEQPNRSQHTHTQHELDLTAQVSARGPVYRRRTIGRIAR